MLSRAGGGMGSDDHKGSETSYAEPKKCPFKVQTQPESCKLANVPIIKNTVLVSFINIAL